MGGLGGLVVGGLIGSMLFGGMGHGFGGGFGLLAGAWNVVQHPANLQAAEISGQRQPCFGTEAVLSALIPRKEYLPEDPIELQTDGLLSTASASTR
jgi:hypothetical protein